VHVTAKAKKRVCDAVEKQAGMMMIEEEEVEVGHRERLAAEVQRVQPHVCHAQPLILQLLTVQANLQVLMHANGQQ